MDANQEHQEQYATFTPAVPAPQTALSSNSGLKQQKNGDWHSGFSQLENGWIFHSYVNVYQRVNFHISLTCIVGPFGDDFPNINHDSGVREDSEVVIIYLVVSWPWDWYIMTKLLNCQIDHLSSWEPNWIQNDHSQILKRLFGIPLLPTSQPGFPNDG